MRKEVNLSDAIGKTIEGIAYPSDLYTHQAVLTFTDGTFTTIGAQQAADSGALQIGDASLNLYFFGDEELERANVVAPGEIDEMRRQQMELRGIQPEE
jgi:hypothetical protein